MQLVLSEDVVHCQCIPNLLMADCMTPFKTGQSSSWLMAEGHTSEREKLDNLTQHLFTGKFWNPQNCICLRAHDVVVKGVIPHDPQHAMGHIAFRYEVAGTRTKSF